MAKLKLVAGKDFYLLASSIIDLGLLRNPLSKTPS